MADSYRVRRAGCPHCGYTLTVAGPPQSACFMLCTACAGVLRFNADMSLRKASLHEALAISPMLLEKLQQVRQAILTLNEELE